MAANADAVAKALQFATRNQFLIWLLTLPPADLAAALRPLRAAGFQKVADEFKKGTSMNDEDRAYLESALAGLLSVDALTPESVKVLDADWYGVVLRGETVALSPLDTVLLASRLLAILPEYAYKEVLVLGEFLRKTEANP